MEIYKMKNEKREKVTVELMIIPSSILYNLYKEYKKTAKNIQLNKTHLLQIDKFLRVYAQKSFKDTIQNFGNSPANIR
jgi:hypothetical protein